MYKIDTVVITIGRGEGGHIKNYSLIRMTVLITVIKRLGYFF